MATTPPKKRRVRRRPASDLPTVRSLQAPDVRDLIPRMLKDDFSVTLWLAGYREGVSQGHLEMQELMAAAAPRAALPERASRPALDMGSDVVHESKPVTHQRPALASIPRVDTAPESVSGEDIEESDTGKTRADDTERPPAEDEEDPEVSEGERAHSEDDLKIGESGYVAWIENHYVYETQRMSTHPKKAKAIALDILAHKVVPDPNGVPPARITYILEQALINAKIHSEVEAEGFRDHHQGPADHISDSAAQRSAERMGATGLAASAGL